MRRGAEFLDGLVDCLNAYLWAADAGDIEFELLWADSDSDQVDRNELHWRRRIKAALGSRQAPDRRRCRFLIQILWLDDPDPELAGSLLAGRMLDLVGTLVRPLQRMCQGQDRILLTPEDAAVLRGVRLVWHHPLWGGQLLLVCCEWAHQGVIRLSPPVLSLVEHVMDHWNDLVRCVRDPSVPASTNRLEGWFGRFKPRARLARGLKTPQGAQAFLHLLAGNLA